ncbi:hypothetical protein F2Q70_00030525 [Brassica cretica]|uniref:Uncharacterized protein n=1 Tax=Brassica cretica TaxID=69181 RepID=A0A8S9FL15_BRACR|nr:hypothetical protein F2Q70_00030525 [Brassica cretica]
MVSSKTLQSCTCSQELALAEPSSPTSYKQDHQELHQISASELTSNQVGHEYFKETPSEATSGKSRAEGASQTQDGDAQPGRRPPSLVALVDECDYTFHGSAGNLHQRETVVPEHQQRGEPQGLGHEMSLNLDVESSVSLALGFSPTPAPSKPDSGFLQKAYAARELDSDQLLSGRMRYPTDRPQGQEPIGSPKKDLRVQRPCVQLETSGFRTHGFPKNGPPGPKIISILQATPRSPEEN